MFNDIKIYEKYLRIVRVVKRYIQQNNINYSNIVREIYQYFSDRIEKFIIRNFKIIDLSINLDIFKRTINDIFFKLKLI